jgi:type II secretory pathway pseudopilin PulG
MNRPVIYGRLGLAIMLPLVVAGLIGLLGWRAWQQQQAAEASLHTVQAAISALKLRQAEYQPGGTDYQRYVALLNNGFAAPDSPPELRGSIKKLAREHTVAIQGIEIGDAQAETEIQAGLALTSQPVVITASATNDAALFAFIDALRQSHHAELTLESLSLKPESARINANLGFSWSSVQGAPQLEYTETPIALSDALAPGKALFATSTDTPAEAPAVMILKVEAVRP